MAIHDPIELKNALIAAHEAGYLAAMAHHAKDASERARLRARSDELYHGAWKALGLMPDLPANEDR